MSITAKELAKKLNLSAAAVSMALNNKPGVSTATRQMVLDAAEKYHYDFSKLQEKYNSSGEIYFVIYKKHGTVVTDTPFFAQLSEGISIGCKKKGYKLKICYLYEDKSTIQQQIEDIQYSSCCALILLGTEMNESDLVPFLDLPMPIVLLDAYFETISCNCVLINNVQGAYISTKYLIQKCQSQPGYLKSSYPISNFNERNSGFYKAIRSCGMSSYNSVVHKLSPSIDGAHSDMLNIIENGEPLASCYFADNDLIAIGAIQAFKEKGYKIPEDISIVGFDNQPMSRIIEPALSTIHVPKQYMGEIAALRVIELLEFPSNLPVKTEISTVLIERDSVKK